jgi:hypothetical protein
MSTLSHACYILRFESDSPEDMLNAAPIPTIRNGR